MFYMNSNIYELKRHVPRRAWSGTSLAIMRSILKDKLEAVFSSIRAAQRPTTRVQVSSCLNLVSRHISLSVIRTRAIYACQCKCKSDGTWRYVTRVKLSACMWGDHKADGDHTRVHFCL